MMLGLSGALGLKALGFVVLALIDQDMRFQAVAYAVPLVSILSNAFLLRSNANISDSRAVSGTGAFFRSIGRLFADRVPQGAASGGRAG